MRSLLYPDVRVYAARKKAGLPGAVAPRRNVWAPGALTPGRPRSRTALAASGSQSLLGQGAGSSGPRLPNKTLSASQSAIALRTIHGTMMRTRVPKEPWKRAHPVAKDPYMCPGLGRKVSKASESLYHTHKHSIKKQQGANFQSPFFKTHISAETPKWMQLRELEPDKYVQYQIRQNAERKRQQEYKIAKARAAEGRDAVSSYESPAWFRTSKNGKKPITNPRSMPFGTRTLPIYDAPPGTKAGLSLQENRTARHRSRLQGPHNRCMTEMVEFCNAAVKQGVKPF
jgi:hypothetical protein